MEDLKTMERRLKVLGSEKRLHIIMFLKSVGSASAGEIAKEVKLSKFATSKHLRILTLSEIIKPKKRGLFVNYRLSLPQEKLVKQVMQLL
jgi:DNA-binding transcriptional ArsR family regulator